MLPQYAQYDENVKNLTLPVWLIKHKLYHQSIITLPEHKSNFMQQFCWHTLFGKQPETNQTSKTVTQIK